jgi:hypothetical protein
MPPIRKLHVFWSLNSADRFTIAEALVIPICISLGFWVLGVPRTQALLRRWARGGKTETLAADLQLEIRNARRAQRIVRQATGLARNCLVRSLTLWTILLRRGLSTDLRVGFRKSDGQIEGHAWVEHDGVPINEDAGTIGTYVPYAQPVSFDLWRRIKRNEHSGIEQRRGSANGNRTRLSPVQLSPSRSKCLQMRSSGMLLPRKMPPRATDVVTRSSFARLIGWLRAHRAIRRVDS